MLDSETVTAIVEAVEERLAKATPQQGNGYRAALVQVLDDIRELNRSEPWVEEKAELDWDVYWRCPEAVEHRAHVWKVTETENAKCLGRARILAS